MRRVAALLTIAAVAAAGSCADDESVPAASDDDVVTIFGPYRGVEADRFMDDLDPWAEANGIEVRYTGSGNLAADLQTRVTESELPDLAIVPQPGLVDRLHRDRVSVALPRSVVEDAEAAMPAPFTDIARVDGALVGVPIRVAVKGLVWYRPEVLSDLGLRPPETLAGLRSLVLDLQDGGQPAWCVGIEAQQATGWAATDWAENLVLRQAGPDVYRRWIAGDVSFGDARIERSFEWFGTTVLQPQRVAGGVNGVLSTPVDSASAPLFSDPPGCVLYQQASFALSWFPDDITVGPDAELDFFVLPGDDADEPAPLVVGADTIVPFRSRNQVEAVLRFLTTPASVRTWVDAGGFLSPLSGVEDDAYPGPERLITQRIEATETIVLDASDAMAPEIGADLFLSEITQWVAGTVTYEDMAATLDDGRAQDGGG